MAIPSQNPAVESFPIFLTAIGFDSKQTFFLFLIAVTSAAIYLATQIIQSKNEDALLPTSKHEIFFLTLVVFSISLLLCRNVVLVMKQDTSPFDTSLIVSLALAVLVGSSLLIQSRFVVAVSSIIVLLSAVFRFRGAQRDWANPVEAWVKEFIPYSGGDPQVLATGVITFCLVGITTLFFVNKYNRKRKVNVAAGRNIGIDTNSLEKLAYLISACVGIIFTMLATGVSLPTVSLFTGLLAAGIGFAAKDILSNIAAGILLIWDGSFKVDDVISIDGGGYGWIDKLTLRHAVIKDRNDVSILVPYSTFLSSTIQNWTHDNRNEVRLKIDIGIAYETKSIAKVRNILIESALKVPRVLPSKPPKVNIIAAGDSAIHLQLRFWINDPKEGIRNVMSSVLEHMISDLKVANIEIPFNTLDVNLALKQPSKMEK